MITGLEQWPPPPRRSRINGGGREGQGERRRLRGLIQFMHVADGPTDGGCPQMKGLEDVGGANPLGGPQDSQAGSAFHCSPLDI